MSSRRPLTISLLLVFCLLVAGLYFIFHKSDTPEDAIAQLNDQNIAVTKSNFLSEIREGHIDTVQLFIKAGAEPDTVDTNGTSAIMVAVESGHKDILALLFSLIPNDPSQSNAIINVQDADGRSALSIAIERDAPDMVTQLLQHGADTALMDKASQTPLLLAVTHKSTDLLPLLIAADNAQHQGANLNAADARGDTPLTAAIRAQSKEIVTILLAAKADGVTADRSGVTPLMVAAETGDETIGAQLLAVGAKTDVADRSGNSPLTIAIQHAHPGFVKFLLDKNADADFHTTGPLPLQVAVTTEPFNTDIFAQLLAHSKQSGAMDPAVLFDAINHKNEALVKLLLDHGVSAKTTDAKGETALYYAVENGLEDSALLLLDKGADFHTSDTSGITPLELATKHNEIKIVQKLLDSGLSPDQKTTEGYTIAEMAVYSGHPEILDALLNKGAKLEKDFSVLWAIRDGGGKCVPVLLKYGAHPNVMNNTGDPALLLAASAGETEAVAALIEYHAPIDYPNTSQGLTPLGAASHAGQLATVKQLVEAGAKLELADAYGMTPLAHSAYMGKPDVVEYLLSKGANVHATDRQGRTVLDLASQGERSPTRDQVLLLLQKQK